MEGVIIGGVDTLRLILIYKNIMVTHRRSYTNYRDIKLTSHFIKLWKLVEGDWKYIDGEITCEQQDGFAWQIYYRHNTRFEGFSGEGK